MSATRKTPYVSVNLTEAARDALRRAALNLTTPAGRRVSMSDALLANLQVGVKHPEEVLEKVRGEK
jgi:hypothetical protein